MERNIAFDFSSPQFEELRQANEERAAFSRFLASLYLYELTEQQIEALAAIQCAGDGSAIDDGLAAMKEYLRHRHGATRQELAVDYARVFLGAGNYDRITAPPYESVFTSEERILMQDARDGALSYYRSIGLDLPADNSTPEDHLGFELQFAAALCDRANEAIAAGDGQQLQEAVELGRSFFAFHQRNWLPQLCDAIDEWAQTDFYKQVAAVTRGYVEAEEAFFAEAAALLGLAEEPSEVKPVWAAEEELPAEAAGAESDGVEPQL